MSQNYSYTFKLINSVSIINLPYAIQNARKLKIKFLRYITGSALNDTLIIKINQFNENVYYDGTRIIKCAKVLPFSYLLLIHLFSMTTHSQNQTSL